VGELDSRTMSSGMREEAMAGFTELGDSLPLQQRKVHRSQAS